LRRGSIACLPPLPPPLLPPLPPLLPDCCSSLALMLRRIKCLLHRAYSIDLS
jgi:hypothetical protein